MTIRFDCNRDEKFVFPVGITVGKIIDSLNTALFALNCRACFSVTLLGEWGDGLLTLAATEVDAIVVYYPVLRKALASVRLAHFTFAWDTEKVQVVLGLFLFPGLVVVGNPRNGRAILHWISWLLTLNRAIQVLLWHSSFIGRQGTQTKVIPGQ